MARPVRRTAATTWPDRSPNSSEPAFASKVSGEVWPPARGLVKPEALPAMVILQRRRHDRDDSLVAAVLGPLEPPKRLYGDEQLK